MFADYHVHTSFSDDSETPMEEMIKKAISIGIDEIAFTEHVDYGVKTDLNCAYNAYFELLDKMQEKYKNSLSIKKGIEFGVQSHTVSLFQKDYEKYNFDFVILSNHQINNKEFWTFDFQEGKTQDEFQQAYYEAIYEVMQKYKNYSVLGHLDMIKRYDKYGNYPDEKILNIVEKIFKLAIEEDKGIEVNTSCFRYGLADLTPSKEILKLYYNLGGKIITIGSDAHEPKYLGDNIKKVKEVLKEIGFKQFCTFDKMKPIYHKL